MKKCRMWWPARRRCCKAMTRKFNRSRHPTTPRHLTPAIIGKYADTEARRLTRRATDSATPFNVSLSFVRCVSSPWIEHALGLEGRPETFVETSSLMPYFINGTYSTAHAAAGVRAKRTTSGSLSRCQRREPLRDPMACRSWRVLGVKSGPSGLQAMCGVDERAHGADVQRRKSQDLLQ